MEKLNGEIEKFLKDRGALRVGFTTQELLEGGPPSCDLSYVLPGAKSAISFYLPLNHKYGLQYLNKESYWKHVMNNIEVNRDAVKIAQEVANFLKKKGYNADVAPPPGQYIEWARVPTLKNRIRDMIYKYMLKNMHKERVKKRLLKIFYENKFRSFLASDSQYRMEEDDWRLTLPPHISHRYIAVRSGVAHMLWSGNAGVKEHGANIILGTIVTDAKLTPTDPLPEEDNFCGGYTGSCKLCLKACPTRMWSNDEIEEVTLGDHTIRYAKRLESLRCQFACGGFTGLDKTKEWSSWCPGRYDIPEDQDEMILTLIEAFLNQKFWPENPDPLYKMPVVLSCDFCQLVCVGNQKETAKRFKALKNSGCIVQNPEGIYEILPAKEAEHRFNSFPQEHRDKYQSKL